MSIEYNSKDPKTFFLQIEKYTFSKKKDYSSTNLKKFLYADFAQCMYVRNVILKEYQIKQKSLNKNELVILSNFLTKCFSILKNYILQLSRNSRSVYPLTDYSNLEKFGIAYSLLRRTVFELREFLVLINFLMNESVSQNLFDIFIKFKECESSINSIVNNGLSFLNSSSLPLEFFLDPSD